MDADATPYGSHGRGPDPAGRAAGPRARGPAGRGRGRPGAVEPNGAGARHRAAGRLRRAGRAGRRPPRTRLRRLRGPDHQPDPRGAARLGPVPRRLSRRRDRRSGGRARAAAAGRARRRGPAGGAVRPRAQPAHPGDRVPRAGALQRAAPGPRHRQPVAARLRARLAGGAALEPGRQVSGDASARAAAVAAARRHVQPGMTIGLGSGRAVFALADALADAAAGKPPLRGVVASPVTEARARAAGLELVGIDDAGRLDLAIDGADELDPRLDLLKGGGAALLREKLVMACADRVLIVAERRKLVQRLGTLRRLPVEVVRFGWVTTRRRLLDLVPDATLRRQPGGEPLVTDEGHYLLDCPIPPGDLADLAAPIKPTLGVVEHGLFLGTASQALLGDDDGTVTTL